MNHDKLSKMGVPTEVADLFINNAVYSPRHQTVLVHALDQMMGVANRGSFVNLSALVEEPNAAFFRQRQAEMYLGFHKKVEPIESLVPLGGLIAARTRSGVLVFNVPLDHLVWTEPMGRFITGANELVKGLAGVNQKQLWVTGTVSSTARQGLEHLGWQVNEQNEARLLGEGDQAAPSYEKPDEKTPSALIRVSAKSVALGAGISWGDGVLQLQGRQYPFSVSGLSLVNIGVSGFTGVGKVYDLKRLADFDGNYVGTQATFAIAGGASDITIRNTKGVVIVLSPDQAKQSGTQLSLGPGGVTLKLK
jgi:hypothetical protein